MAVSFPVSKFTGDPLATSEDGCMIATVKMGVFNPRHVGRIKIDYNTATISQIRATVLEFFNEGFKIGICNCAVFLIGRDYSESEHGQTKVCDISNNNPGKCKTLFVMDFSEQEKRSEDKDSAPPFEIDLEKVATAWNDMTRLITSVSGLYH